MDESGVGRHPLFSRWTGRGWPWGPNGSYEGFFGGDVLQGLTEGLDHFLDGGHRYRGRKPGVVGCTPWLTDGAVVERLVRFSECRVVINKPESMPDDLRSFDEVIRRLHESGRGLNRDLLRGIDSTRMAPRLDGEPVMRQLGTNRWAAPRWSREHVAYGLAWDEGMRRSSHETSRPSDRLANLLVRRGAPGRIRTCAPASGGRCSGRTAPPLDLRKQQSGAAQRVDLGTHWAQSHSRPTPEGPQAAETVGESP